eukprot:1161059-Pelagomonas_calceolata.AAC.6
MRNMHDNKECTQDKRMCALVRAVCVRARVFAVCMCALRLSNFICADWVTRLYSDSISCGLLFEV